MSPNRGVGAKWPAFYSIMEQEMAQWWEHLSLWPRIKSLHWRHMWVEFVAGCLLCSERFFSGYSGFPLSSKIIISKFQFDQGSGRLHGCATSKSLFNCHLFISCTWCYLLLYFRKLNRCFVKLPIFCVSLWALYISIEPCCPTTKS